MSTILTLSIPAYNMEKYLGRCLESVLFAELVGDVEILLINDGSKDATLEVAKEYAEKYKGLLRIIDKPNGGWGSAINCAIKESSGAYFRILDSDDWFDGEAFKEYVKLLRETNADIVATSYRFEYSDGSSKDVIFPADQCDKVISFGKYLRSNGFRHNINLSCMTIRTSLLKEHNIVVADKYYADLDYVNSALAFVKTIMFTQINLYRYFIGRDGQSTSIAGYNAHLSDYLNVTLKQVLFYEKHKALLSDETRKMYQLDFPKLLTFGYFLLMSPIYSGSNPQSKQILRDYNARLRLASPELYKLAGIVGRKKGIRYISIWRLFKINILKIK